MLTLEQLDVKTRDYVPVPATHCIRGMGYNGEISFATCRACPFYIQDRQHGWQIRYMRVINQQRIVDDDDCDYTMSYPSSDIIVFECPVCGNRIQHCGQRVSLAYTHDEIQCDACATHMVCTIHDKTPQNHVAVAIPLSTDPQITISSNDP
jgi:hypothetical protein